MGKTLYLLSSGALRRKDNTLFVERAGEPGQKPRFLPVETTDEIMVMGGALIYEQTWSRADRLLLTEIALDPPGDAWLAAPDPAQWQEVSRQNGTSQDGVAYAFIEYRRHQAEA